MPAVLLVRHAQASFAGPEYDVLSDVGRKQAGILGARFDDHTMADVVVHGAMRRQRHTAELCLPHLGDISPTTDGRWDEYDHQDLLSCALADVDDREAFEAEIAAAGDERRQFQRMLDVALERWTAGEHDDYRESYAQFIVRVRAALSDLLGGLGRSQTGVVFTSGGVISAVCAELLGLSPQRWAALNQVMVNTGITKLVHGRSGTNLLTVNDHAHLEGDHRSLLTYR